MDDNPGETMPGQTIKEYDHVRVIATMLVVMGHCTYLKIATDFGGCDYSYYFDSNNIISRLLVALNSLIYTFHMPLFMALSGALFYRNIRAGDYRNLKQLIAIKSKRLILPFVVVSLFYSIPLKYISGYYRGGVNLHDIICGQLFLQGNSHLWYCVALFNILIIVFGLEIKIKMSDRFKMVLLVIMYLGSFVIHINIIKYTFRYLVWFYMGYNFEPQREFINSKIKSDAIFKNMILFLLFYMIYGFMISGELLIMKAAGEFIKAFGIVFACLAFYEVAYLLSKTNIDERRLWNIIRSDSFGIYLYSDTWNYIILSVVILAPPNFILVNRFGILPLYILRFLITLLISVLVTELLRMLKLKYLF